MFSNTQVTLNTLVTLEDAFIAAYLVGVRDFSTSDLRVTAARIMGIESDHRTLARVIGPDVAAMDGGPIPTITGLSGMPENVAPPNNNGYERTACWTKISRAISGAETPFVDMTAARRSATTSPSRSFYSSLRLRCQRRWVHSSISTVARYSGSTDRSLRAPATAFGGRRAP